MKKFLLISALLINAFTVTSVFANKSDCDENPLQCVYITGLDENNLADGRYIKSVILTKNLNVSIIGCSNNPTTYSLEQNDGPFFQGKISQEYSICTDVTGTHCELLKSFNTDVYQDPKTYQYVANPQYVDIDLSKVKNNYPACDVTESFGQQKLMSKLKNYR